MKGEHREREKDERKTAREGCIGQVNAGTRAEDGAIWNPTP